ncbi:MAG TPA: hypothetical protein VMG09_00705 [Bacteroidota bacterium]|nr:hypothetical protein [Bacteroidota bacterium]
MSPTLDDVLRSLQTQYLEVNRAAESLGVAAESVGSGSLAPGQMAQVAEGLRDLQFELQDLGDALKRAAQDVRIAR